MSNASLRSLVESKALDGVTKLTGYLADPNSLTIEEGWNGRDETPELLAYRAQLKAAMKAGAAIPAVDVQVVDGVPTVRDGHQRTLMARELVAEGHPYKLQVREVKGNDADMLYHMVGTGSGKHLSPVEAGRQFLKLTRMGATVAEIAGRLGVNRSTIENGLALAEMPKTVQNMVAAGKVASHTALKVVKTHGKDAAKVLATAAETVKPGKKVTPKALPAGPGPKERGQTLPPAEVQAASIWLGANQVPVSDVALLVERLSCISTAVTVLPRDLIVELVKEAKRLMGATA